MLKNLKIGVARRILATDKTEYPGTNINKGRRIGVILDVNSEEVKSRFSDLMRDMGLRETDFQIVVCREEVEKDELFQGLVFSRKDINWKGKIRNGDIAHFVQQPLGILICFTRSDSKLASLLTEVVQADLKVGRAESFNSKGLYNLVIATEFEQQEVFIEEFKKYLQILNINGNG